MIDQLGRGEAATARLRHLGREGAEIDLDTAFTPVTGSDGKTSKILALSTNATEQAREDAAGRKARQGLENISAAVMTVNRDFIVTYVNKATQELLARNADAFRRVWPGFEPTHIVGMCIDTFHRNPAHQRRIMVDTSKLPFRTDIGVGVGDLKFALNVSASYDQRGNYDGNILE